jgi:hypothetical protein
VLLDLLVDQLAAFRVKPERFAVMAEAAQREYANVAFQQVYQWAMYRAEVGEPGGGAPVWLLEMRRGYLSVIACCHWGWAAGRLGMAVGAAVSCVVWPSTPTALLSA